MIERGGLLPAAYHGNAFVCEPLANLVHRRALEPSGATFIARRVEQGREFLASTDPAFRPVNLANGPDGALYLVDMYRELVEHPQFVPERRGRPSTSGAGMTGADLADPAEGPRAAIAARRPNFRKADDRASSPCSVTATRGGATPPSAPGRAGDDRDGGPGETPVEFAPALRGAEGTFQSPARLHALWILNEMP